MKALLIILFSSCLFAQSERLPEAPDFKASGWTALVTGKNLNGWTGRAGKPHTWFTATSVRWAGEGDPKRLLAQTAPGPIIINGADGRTADLLTTNEFGDSELYLEFMISRGSNSGVYIQGLYEVQILDSFGVATPGVHDCGAIYERWIDGKGVGGSVPTRNVSRAPGQWQSFLIRFRAPRFDGHGKKVENGRFLKVLHNGVSVHENVAVEGPTRASMEYAERPKGPLMIQGDHGPVALRNIYVRALD